MATNPKYDESEFDWIKLSAEIQPDEDGFMQKTAKKFKENPFVPLGE